MSSYPTTREAEKLARDYAAVRGYQGRPGGWIYNPAGRPVAHGWSAFTALLSNRGRILRTQAGQWFINWRADDLQGHTV